MNRSSQGWVFSSANDPIVLSMLVLSRLISGNFSSFFELKSLTLIVGRIGVHTNFKFSTKIIPVLDLIRGQEVRSSTVLNKDRGIRVYWLA